jgi:hypothetical protein
MLTLDKAVVPLNFTINIEDLQEFYQTVKTQYSHLQWTWEKNYIHLDNVAAAECAEPSQTIMNGWMMQSNMADTTLPPSMLKTKHPTVDWYDTELMFGVAQRLREKIPFAYRWTLFVLPPGGQVVSHVDPDQYVIIIPIQWEPEALFNLDGVPYTFVADGSAYVLNVELPHDTINNSAVDRVNIIARVPRECLEELLAITGKI